MYWIWKTADWQERESYDMFGLIYERHPNLKRILMPEDWVGWPLRKDYSRLQVGEAQIIVGAQYIVPQRVYFIYLK